MKDDIKTIKLNRIVSYHKWNYVVPTDEIIETAHDKYVYCYVFDYNDFNGYATYIYGQCFPVDDMTENYNATLNSDITYWGETYSQTLSDELNPDYLIYDYRLTTPWKFNVSMGTTLQNLVAIGAEYEYQDYYYLLYHVYNQYVPVQVFSFYRFPQWRSSALYFCRDNRQATESVRVF